MAKTDRISVVVCDAGPLIHLDELDALHLLADFERVLVPDAVWQEVRRHRPRITERPDIPLIQAPPPGPPGAALVAMSRLMPLHAGEMQALQIAETLHADLLLTDDTAARLAAKQLGLPVHGTLGILLRAVRRKQSSALAIADLLRSITRRSTLHIKPSLLDEVIAVVEQEGEQTGNLQQRDSKKTL